MTDRERARKTAEGIVNGRVFAYENGMHVAREFLKLEAENAELEKRGDDLYEIADEWRKDYDRLKEKYEPTIVVLSELEAPKK